MNILIKLIITLLVSGISLSSNTYAVGIPPGYVEKLGVINNDEVWSGNVYISGDINTNCKITILPGTNILVAANSDKNNLSCDCGCDGIVDFCCWRGINNIYDNKCGVHLGEPFRDEMNHISIRVKELYAIGNPLNPITIKSDAANPGIYDWNYFSFDGILSYVNISNYRALGPGLGSIINNCKLQNIGECGICSPQSDNLLIYSNTISNSGHELIDIHNRNPIIKNNIFNGPAVNNSDNGSPIIENNKFNPINNYDTSFEKIQTALNVTLNTITRHNTINKYSTIFCNNYSNAITKYNNIYSSTIYIGAGCDDKVIDLSGNYWGTTNKNEIYNKFVDSNGLSNNNGGNVDLNKIIIDPILYSPIVHVTLISPAIDATDISVETSIEVNFSDQTDPLTVNTNTFIVTNGSSIIDGIVSYTDGKAVFKPLVSLDYNTKFTVTLKGTISDLSKNKMNDNYAWSFTTDRVPIPTSTPCTATLNGSLSLHIPYLSYVDPASGTLSLWADLVYDSNPSYPALIPFKLTNYAIITSPAFSCAASTLSSDLKIYVPDVLLPDGITHLWMNLEYNQAFSTDRNAYFVVSNYGAVSN
jgi:hypothetical protein